MAPLARTPAPRPRNSRFRTVAKLNELHAGDRVSFAVSEAAGSKTITKIGRAEAVTKIDKK